jgi:hypothetical protein
MPTSNQRTAAPKSSLLDYEEWKPEDAIGSAQEVAAASESGNFWKPKAGENVIRILPGRRDLHRTPLVPTWSHYVEIAGEERGVSFLCPRKHKAGHACPGCMRLEELRGTGNPADYKAAASFLPKLRVYANVIDRRDPGVGPQTFAFGKTVYDPLMSYRSSDPAIDIPFTNPDDTGCDVVIVKKGEGKQTEYSVRLAKAFSALSHDDEQALAWLEAMRDLRKETRILSTQDIWAKLTGDDGGGQGHGGGRPAPAGGRALGGGGRPAAAGGSAVRGVGVARPRSVSDDMGYGPADEELDPAD